MSFGSHRSHTRSAGCFRKALAAVVCAGAVALVAVDARDDRAPRTVRVVAVYDGDTITVEADGGTHRVRLLGIDVPERSYARLVRDIEKLSRYAPRSEREALRTAQGDIARWAAVVESYGDRARAALRRMVLGREARLSYDPQQGRRDQYGRVLAYVGVDGMDVSRQMMLLGWAVAEERFPCKRTEAYRQAEAEARRRGVGIWRRRERE